MISFVTLGFWDLRDPVSSTTHAAACLWALFGTLLLWRLSQSKGRRVQMALVTFGISMVLLYGASATYHALKLPSEELRFFQLLDHSAIYGLIAGTYTPAFYVLLPDRPFRRLLLSGIWGLALLGILLKWTVTGVPYWLTVTLYLSMGWVGLLAVLDLIRAVGLRGMAWGLYGGLAYTLGGLVDLFQWPRFIPGFFSFHEVFHLFVIGGTFCHFIFMVRHVIPYRRSLSPRPARQDPAPALTLQPEGTG